MNLNKKKIDDQQFTIKTVVAQWLCDPVLWTIAEGSIKAHSPHTHTERVVNTHTLWCVARKCAWVGVQFYETFLLDFLFQLTVFEWPGDVTLYRLRQLTSFFFCFFLYFSTICAILSGNDTLTSLPLLVFYFSFNRKSIICPFINFRSCFLFFFFYFLFPQDVNAARAFGDEAANILDRAISGVLSRNALLYFAYADFEEGRMKYDKVHQMYNKFLSLPDVDPTLVSFFFCVIFLICFVAQQNVLLFYRRMCSTWNLLDEPKASNRRGPCLKRRAKTYDQDIMCLWLPHLWNTTAARTRTLLFVYLSSVWSDSVAVRNLSCAT